MQRSPLFSRETARVLVGGRLSRILNWLSISQQELARQLSSHTPEATTTISATHLSNMIAGRRDLSGHLPDIVRVLAARVIPGERPAAAQEFRDWYGLLAVLLAACGQAATPATAPTVAPASPTTILTSTPAPTNTTAPALTVGEAETLVAQIQPTLCAPATHIPSGLHPGVQVGEQHTDRAVSASARGALIAPSRHRTEYTALARK
jgi:hypothetical protein